MAPGALAPSRLAAVVAPVCAVGAAAAAAAALSFARADYSPVTIAWIAALLAASAVAQRYPVPLEGLDTRGVDVGFVFGVAGVVLFGWPAGVLVAALSQVAAGLWERHAPVRVAYNSAAYGIAALVAGVLVGPLPSSGAGAVSLRVAICSLVQYAVNLILITGVVCAHRGGSYRRLIRAGAGSTALPFTLMGATALILVVLWQRTPALSLALFGPLLAISLYQRSQHRALTAIRLAQTDPLTGLGNHRHFQERLERELAEARGRSSPLTLCLLDVDDFKAINDRFGHPAGDRVLARIATQLRHGGEAFRLGGDEFAILLANQDDASALAAARSIAARVEALDLGEVEPVTLSAGIASFPAHGRDRDELIRLADGALYVAKERGKDRIHVAPGGVVGLRDEEERRSGGLAAGLRAAAGLVAALEARDAWTGEHCRRVAQLAGRIAERLGLAPAEVELTRLAASLHEVGKLALPDELLLKPGPLAPAERVLVERHARVAHRLLEGVGVRRLAESVLHFHEHWDGTGYPGRLAAEEIPLAARVGLVADTLDTLTSPRTPRRGLTLALALAELEHRAGTRLDPRVVDAAAAELVGGRRLEAVAS